MYTDYENQLTTRPYPDTHMRQSNKTTSLENNFEERKEVGGVNRQRQAKTSNPAAHGAHNNKQHRV